MQFEWIVFDADETLFHFVAYQGLKKMFADEWDTDFTSDDFKQYQTTNQPLWVAYQDGEIDATALKHRRFSLWAERLGVSPEVLNRQYLNGMAAISTMMPHAAALLTSLKGQAQLAIITNGFEDMQSARLAKHGLSERFAHVIISEQVGVAKPDPEIFDAAYQKMGCPEKSKVLMVGDNVQSDILGAGRFGFQTCWVNHHQAQLPSDIACDYQVAHLGQLWTDVLASESREK